MNGIIQLFILATLFTSLNTPSTDPVEINLNDYRWQNRILLIYAEHPSDLVYSEQISHFAEHHAGIEERDLFVISIFTDEPSLFGKKEMDENSTKQMTSRYFSDTPEFRLILIGKDGGVKLREDELVTTEDLFGLIDSMPMRRSEMRRGE